jgi:hypothetical protein
MVDERHGCDRSGKRGGWIVAVALSVCCSQIELDAAAAPTMVLSGDRTYLVDASGAPVFINGDTAWALIAQPTNSQIQTYLTNRQEKGYNAIIASLIEAKFAANAPENAVGDAPFTGAPFATPNEAYFARVDWILQEAATRGITVLLAPAYVGYGCGDEGWCAELQAASLSTMRSYGRYLGNRYKDAPNIVWMIGADTNPFDHNVDEKLAEIVAGIKEFDAEHLMTAHVGPETSAQEIWGTPSWLDLNNVYTYSTSGTQAKTFTEYNRSGALPLFLLETAYENEHSSTALSLRTSAYQAVLWGARLGHFFGNCPIWPFGAPSAASFCSSTNWQAQLNSSGSTTVAYVGDLMRSRRHWLMRPDHANTVMTAGQGSGATRAVTSRATDGSSVIAYLPTRRQVTIDMTEVAGSNAKAWWWNPRTNVASDAGLFATTGSQNFTPPDSNDWVLVLDDLSVGFPPPGSAGGTVAVPMAPTNLTAN